MAEGHERAKRVLKGETVFQKNNLESLLNRAIKFKKSQYTDEKLERFKQQYAPINAKINGKVKHNNAGDDAIAETFDTHGFERPSKNLFSKDKLNAAWTDIQPVGSGLVNLQQSALNAVLHALTFTPALANYLLSRSHSSNCTVQEYCFVCALEDLVRALIREAGNSVSARFFVGKLKNMNTGSPNDVVSIWHFFMDQIQHFLLLEKGSTDKRVQQTTALYQIFGGFLQNKMECTACQKTKLNYDAFLQLSLDISQSNTVEKCLTKLLKKDLTGTTCDGCAKPFAQGKYSMYRTPMVLVLCLGRLSMVNGEGNKNDKMVKYEEKMTLKRQLSEDASEEDADYSLYAVIVHNGSYYGGRYVTYLKGSNGVWYCLDNQSVQLVSIKKVLGQQAHMLFYTQKPKATPQNIKQSVTAPLSTDVLSAMREKESNSSLRSVDEEQVQDINDNSYEEGVEYQYEDDEENSKLEKALAAAKAKKKVESKDAIVVEQNDTVQSKRSKLDSLLNLEMSQGKSVEVKEQLLAKPAHSQFYDSVGRWDDEDLGNKIEENRKQALKQTKPKRKHVDAYDLDYDRGKMKKVKNKKKDIFGKPNAFQIKSDMSQSNKRS